MHHLINSGQTHTKIFIDILQIEFQNLFTEALLNLESSFVSDPMSSVLAAVCVHVCVNTVLLASQVCYGFLCLKPITMVNLKCSLFPALCLLKAYLCGSV